jgi:exodeoxyribonuclease VII large subunit
VSDNGFLFEGEKTKIYTVSALTEEIKTLLEGTFDFIWVEGEISNFRVPASGHYYMVLKDEKAQIRAVMFRPQSRYLKFRPEDGMKVIAQGRVAVYEPRGEYQIILDYLEPLGVGALALAFEQLKKKLAAQGVFDQEVKKPLPYLPQRVAVITSPTGAAIRDFLKVIQRRFANIEITIVPVKVQGDEAAEEMVEALDLVNRELDVDVIVLTRGGGSLEDLWAFNREELALAIRASRIPVVSAVGHEIDTTISDLAADLRAPTPSAAAEILVREKEAMAESLRQLGARLQRSVKNTLTYERQRLHLFSKRVRDPRRQLEDLWMHLDELSHKLSREAGLVIAARRTQLHGEIRALMLHAPSKKLASLVQELEFQTRTARFLVARRLGEFRSRLSLLDEKIKNMNPLAVLKRGYSITWKMPDQRILKEASHVRKGDQVKVTLSEGGLECRVEKMT